MAGSDNESTSRPASWFDFPIMSRELMVPMEMAQLLIDPVYYGVGVPRGAGAPVLVLPGFLGNDLYLAPLRGWLRRLNYRPFESHLLSNAGCPEDITASLRGRAERIVRSSGSKVTIIGHSLGGLLGRALAASAPNLVARVIALGSPFAVGMRTHPLTESLVEIARQGMRPFVASDRQKYCYTTRCACAAMTAFAAPLPDAVPFTSIYSRTDGVVFWRHCQDADPARNIEVQGTHYGLACNAQVYRHVARLLAL